MPDVGCVAAHVETGVFDNGAVEVIVAGDGEDDAVCAAELDRVSEGEVVPVTLTAHSGHCVRVSLRIRRLPLSATNKFPAASMARP